MQTPTRRPKQNRSEDKRQALIEAAGILLSQRGNPNLVGTREIVAKARASKSAIDYYFGNKSKLLDVIYEEIRHIYDRNIIADYLESNRSKLSTKEGQKEFIEGLFNKYSSYFKNQKSNWRSILCKSMIKNNTSLPPDLLSVHFSADMSAWKEIFEIITGKNSAEEAYAWYESSMQPICARFYSSYKFSELSKYAGIDQSYEDFFIKFSVERLLKEWNIVE